jgi:hypothetical protein
VKDFGIAAVIVLGVLAFIALLCVTFFTTSDHNRAKVERTTTACIDAGYAGALSTRDGDLVCVGGKS